jgi:restriction system protein
VPIPAYQDIMLPLLKWSSDGTTRSASDAIEFVADAFKVSDAEREERLPSGRTLLLNNRTHWALTHLRHARLIERDGHGRFRMTDRGRSVLKESPSRIDRKYLSRFAEFQEFLGVSPTVVAAPSAIAPSEESLSPEELLETTYRSLRHEVEQELVDRLRSGSPLFFEKAVLSVLVGMGYGGSRADAAQHLGRPGDEGLAQATRSTFRPSATAIR